jgi:two-component system LytT family response regulator
MTRMISCIVVDDEPKAREVIKRYIDKVDWLSFLAEFKNPVKALGYLQQNKADLVFLDINMPGINGVEFVKSLVDKPNIIFTTAYSEYALEGYENDVLDYLLKPIRFDRFIKAMNKLQKKVNESREPGAVVVKSGYRYHRVQLDTILYLEKDGNYLEIFRTNGDKILLRENMGNIFELIPESEFIRVHKSFVVSKKRISAVEANRVIMQGNIDVPLGASFREALMEWFTTP